MNTARLAAEGVQGSRLYGIVLRNDNHAPPADIDDPEFLVHPDYFIAVIRSALGYQGKVEIIDPPKLGSTQMTKGVAGSGS
jgi:hypothetical protein